MLIDLDHVPLALGSRVWTGSPPRPYTHALWVVAVLAATAAISSRLSAASRGKTAAATVTSVSGAGRLCDILGCGPRELIEPVTAARMAPQEAPPGPPPRPVRARVAGQYR